MTYGFGKSIKGAQMADQASGRPVSGWILFSGALLLFLGVFNVIDGVAVLSKDEFFAEEELLFGDLSAWGWVYLVLGVLQLGSSYLVYQQKMSGMILAVSWAFLSCTIHLVTVGAYPIWSLSLVVLSFMVMFGLLTNSDQFS